MTYDEARKQAFRNEQTFYCPDCQQDFPGSELDNHYFSCASNNEPESATVLLVESSKEEEDAEQEFWPSEQFPNM
jgi:hypothetical protein